MPEGRRHRNSQAGDDGGRIAKPLPAGEVPGAVTSDVAARLHARACELSFNRGDEVGAGIRWAPASLRADLARAVGSNAKVNASGESGRERTTLPVIVKSMCDALVDQVQAALMALSAEDESGSQYLSPGAARRLAAEAVLGRYKVLDYVREARAMMGRSAPREGSIAELRGGWRLLRCALMAASEPLFGMPYNEAGVGKLEARVYASGGTLVLDARSLQQMLRRVFDSWELRCRDFRSGGAAWPSFMSCTEEHGNFFATKAAAASLRAELQAAGSSGGRVGDVAKGGSGEKRSPGVSAGDGAKEAERKRRELPEGGPPQTSAKSFRKDEDPLMAGGYPCAWPEKPKLEPGAFEKFCAAVRTECPDTCRFFLIGKCRKADCAKSHKVPAAFVKIKERFN